jgi:hypothetical protein
MHACSAKRLLATTPSATNGGEAASPSGIGAANPVPGKATLATLSVVDGPLGASFAARPALVLPRSRGDPDDGALRGGRLVVHEEAGAVSRGSHGHGWSGVPERTTPGREQRRVPRAQQTCPPVEARAVSFADSLARLLAMQQVEGSNSLSRPASLNMNRGCHRRTRNSSWGPFWRTWAVDTALWFFARLQSGEAGAKALVLTA